MRDCNSHTVVSVCRFLFLFTVPHLDSMNRAAATKVSFRTYPLTTEEAARVFEALPNCVDSLRELNLSGSVAAALRIDSLQALPEFHSLRVLRLSCETVADAVALLAYFAASNGIETLQFRCCTPEVIDAVRNLPSVRSLIFDDENSNPDTVTALADLLQERLIRVQVAKQAVCIKRFATAEGESRIKLVSKLPVVVKSDSAGVLLARAVQLDGSIKCLEITLGSDCTDASLTAWARAIEHHEKLKDLSLEHRGNVTGQANYAFAFAQAMRANSSLCKLHLYIEALDSSAITTIFEGFGAEGNTALESLVLVRPSYCERGVGNVTVFGESTHDAECARAWARVLLHNMSLRLVLIEQCVRERRFVEALKKKRSELKLFFTHRQFRSHIGGVGTFTGSVLLE